MSAVAAIVTLSPRDFDAVLFDLDGVLTRTASVHAAARKKLFDASLEQRSSTRGEVFVPFDIDTDYRRYVDGKPELDRESYRLRYGNIQPRLPEELARLELRIRHRGRTLDLKLTRDSFTVSGRERGVLPIRLSVGDEVVEFACGTTPVFQARCRDDRVGVKRGAPGRRA